MTEYSYDTEKEHLFTPNGIKLLLKIRETIDQLLDDAGAFMIDKVVQHHTGDTFQMLACIDYLEDIGEIRRTCMCSAGITQMRVYIRGM